MIELVKKSIMDLVQPITFHGGESGEKKKMEEGERAMKVKACGIKWINPIKILDYFNFLNFFEL